MFDSRPVILPINLAVIGKATLTIARMDVKQFNAERVWTRNYAPGVPRDIEPVTSSIYDLLRDRAEQFGDSPALEFFGREWTFAQMHDEVLRVANGLRRLGVKPEDRVALVMPNCPQHVIAYHAVLRLGAIVAEHNPLYTRSELLTQFRDHGATVSIVWDKVAPLVQSLAGEVEVSRVISVNITKAMPLKTQLLLKLPVAKARESREKLTAKAPGTVPFEKVAAQQPLPDTFPMPTASSIASLAYTSGTTGVPKGAILTHKNLLSNAYQGKAWMPEFKTGAETIYGMLPIFHSFGLLLGFSYGLVAAARVVLFPSFDGDLIVEASKRHPATFMPGVPPMFDKMARLAKQGQLDISNVHYAMSGAMTLSQGVVDRWEAHAGGGLNEGYGLTEASPFAVVNPFGDNRKVGTIGLPCPSTTVKVVDQNHPETEVELGEPGELLIHGPQVFQGYWRNDEETQKTLLPGGWLRTGDIVVQDEDGFLTIVDRKKELIITGGYNVSPSEVERVISAVPGIAETAVVGITRGTSNVESVTAVVVLDDGAVFDEAAVRAHAHQHLADYKVPRSYVVWDELPKNLLGKVQRKQIRDKLSSKN